MKPELERFIQAKRFEDLRGEFPDLQHVAKAWCEAAHQELEATEDEWSTKLPDELDAIEVKRDGVTFRIFGVVHGWTGGGSQDYRDFVRKRLTSEPQLLCEKMLGTMYLGRGTKEIPDFTVLGWLGQWRLAFGAMLGWPRFFYYAIVDMFRERSGKEPEKATLSSIFDSIRYHNLHPELRRAVGGDLPTRLQIEYEMSQWSSWKRYLYEDLLVAVVPRSAYIAEFARVWAEKKQVKEVGILVGDRHLTEVAEFLRNPVGNASILRSAARHARWIAKIPGAYTALFGLYMLNLVFGAAFGALPWMIAALWLSM